MTTIEAKCIKCGHPFLVNFPEPLPVPYWDPGARCPITDPFWCSRDAGHDGAHVNRSATGPGMIGWPRGAAVLPPPDLTLMEDR